MDGYTRIPHGHEMTVSESILSPERGWTGEELELSQNQTDARCPVCTGVVEIVD